MAIRIRSGILLMVAALCACASDESVSRSAQPAKTSSWVSNTERWWEAQGKAYFESVPEKQAHAMILLRDTATRTGVGAFDIWLFVDGRRVQNWPSSSPLRVAPGPHCLRAAMVATQTAYEGTLATYAPWLYEGQAIELTLVRPGEQGYEVQYRVVSGMSLKDYLGKDLKEAEEYRSILNQLTGSDKTNHDTIYEYCSKYISERNKR